MRLPKSEKEKRVFLSWFAAVLCFFILLFGFCTVDYNGRKMSFNDKTRPVEVEEMETGETMLKIRLMDYSGEIDVTPVKNFFDFFCKFTCIFNQ